MAADEGTSQTLDELVRDTRMAREALHKLIERMQRDRYTWQRDFAALMRGARLTAAQRRRLREGLLRPRRADG